MNRQEALIEAVATLGLAEKIAPRSAEAAVILKTIRGWIQDLGPDQAVETIRRSRDHLMAQIDLLSSP